MRDAHCGGTERYWWLRLCPAFAIAVMVAGISAMPAEIEPPSPVIAALVPVTLQTGVLIVDVVSRAGTRFLISLAASVQPRL
ncbi:MAG: hypothetical protein M9944_03580 [Rhizobiaceae bacterium]|nr:hypothetical protein [Rhizobiaceae bacterium]